MTLPSQSWWQPSPLAPEFPFKAPPMLRLAECWADHEVSTILCFSQGLKILKYYTIFISNVSGHYHENFGAHWANESNSLLIVWHFPSKCLIISLSKIHIQLNFDIYHLNETWSLVRYNFICHCLITSKLVEVVLSHNSSEQYKYLDVRWMFSFDILLFDETSP